MGNVADCRANNGQPEIFYYEGVAGYGDQGNPPRVAILDYGGHKMPAAWVNMVQKTQTGHLPDPYNPAPVEQGFQCQNVRRCLRSQRD